MKDARYRALLSGGEQQLRGPNQLRMHCVLDKSGEAVRCFRSRALADRVAKNLGGGHKVKTKKR